MYQVIGEDTEGSFQVQRRYKEFRLLRQFLSDRFPGMYVPPIPPKKATGNKNDEFIEARCFYLNMFFKQMVRIPYLLESEELNNFIRPSNDVSKALTFMPKMSNQKLLERLTEYYTVEYPKGELNFEDSNDLTAAFNLKINDFGYQCRKNIQFLGKFKETVDKMRENFDGEWASDTRLNQFFFDYEKSVLTNYLLGIQNKDDDEKQSEQDNSQRQSKDQRSIIDSE